MAGKNNNKDPLERLFQKKAEEYDIPYREEDWLKLEKKLDLRDAQTAYRKKLAWLAAASILIISLLGYYTFENHNRLNEISEQLSSVEVVPEEGAGEPPLFEELPPVDPQQPATTDTENGIAQDGHTDSPVVTPDDRTAESLLPDLAEAIEQPFDETTDPYGLPAVERFSLDPVSSNLSCPSCALLRLSSFDEIASVYQVRGTERVLLSDEAGLIVADGRGLQGVEEEPMNDFGSDRASRLSAGFVLAPDLSTVGSIANFYDPGYKAGFTLEYKLSSNLAITTGIMQSMVRYTAHEREYKPPVYWSDGIAPEEIIGECLLIDIPVSLKFDFLHFNHSRFFATAGLSSYIMLNEDYYFSYDSDETGLMQGWSGETGTRHWMSNAGFSIGYELDIHSNWSLRAEPFLKIPIREIGWGNVKLYSMGSFFSINYKL